LKAVEKKRKDFSKKNIESSCRSKKSMYLCTPQITIEGLSLEKLIVLKGVFPA
jgi:hypothetical protein